MLDTDPVAQRESEARAERKAAFQKAVVEGQVNRIAGEMAEELRANPQPRATSSGLSGGTIEKVVAASTRKIVAGIAAALRK